MKSYKGLTARGYHICIIYRLMYEFSSEHLQISKKKAFRIGYIMGPLSRPNIGPTG